ncbi:1,4-alpha-glucan branching enzyme, partial [Streptomyces sp. SID10244]|nr:1,4-alpha-glucan branching enzyme [Streptomyces sp. SID10244]
MTKTTKSPEPYASDHDLRRLFSLTHPDPHSFLGAHETDDGWTILRTLRPDATAVVAVIGEADHPMQRQSDDLWVVAVPITALIDYRYRVSYPGGSEYLVADGYRFLPSLGEVDVHLFSEGRHES